MQANDLLQLAEQFGSPLYVYDAEKIQSQYNRLTKAFSKVANLRINYAMKALSNVAILQLLCFPLPLIPANGFSCNKTTN